MLSQYFFREQMEHPALVGDSSNNSKKAVIKLRQLHFVVLRCCKTYAQAVQEIIAQ